MSGQSTRRWAGFLAFAFPGRHDKNMIDRLPKSDVAPVMEIRARLAENLPDDVENGIHDFAHVRSAPTSARFRGRDKGRELDSELPLNLYPTISRRCSAPVTDAENHVNGTRPIACSQIHFQPE